MPSKAVADEPVDRVVLPVGDFHDLARQSERQLHPRRACSWPSKGRLSTEKRCKSVPTPASRSRFAAVKAATVSGAAKPFSCSSALARAIWSASSSAWRSGPSVRREISARPLRHSGRPPRGRARKRQFRRLQPIARRRLGEPGLGVMMRDDRRRGLDLVGETLHQRPRDVGMDALAAAAQQRGIGRVLHQRMLEDVARFRRRAARVDQLGRHELAEGVLQRRPLDRRQPPPAGDRRTRARSPPRSARSP